MFETAVQGKHNGLWGIVAGCFTFAMLVVTGYLLVY